MFNRNRQDALYSVKQTAPASKPRNKNSQDENKRHKRYRLKERKFALARSVE